MIETKLSLQSNKTKILTTIVLPEDADNENLICEDSNEAVDIYDLNGRKLDKPQKGINIIRYSDGTTRKVLVK